VTQPDGIGIVIVTYNSGREIGPCLDAALATGAEIVVVDNASADETVDEVRRRGVRLIANGQNRGFAAAVNQGFSVVRTPLIVVLNPDAVIRSSLEPLREACSRPDAAGAGGCLVGADGRPQAGFMVRRLPTPAALVLEVLLLNRLWPGNPINRRYRACDLEATACVAVEQPAGAFLMLRRAVWDELGGFDEGYFPLWFEDVDFCKRAAARGYRFYFAPFAVAYHTGGHSTVRLEVEKRRVYWYRSLLRYSARHFRPTAFRVVCVAVVIGSLPRLVVESLLLRSAKPVAAYGKVMRLAGRCLFGGWRDALASPGSQIQG